MNYNKLEEAKRLYKTANKDQKYVLESLFPELAESEDERIRKELLKHIKANKEASFRLFKKFSPDDVISWLERQGKQKPTDIVKPKFKVGDWIINKFRDICLITDIDLENGYYICESNRFDITDGDINLTDKAFHLWSIEDVKDGDVLVGRYGTFIFMGKNNGGYCGVLSDNNNTFIRSTGNNEWTKGLHPATKEQRETLMKAMTDAGYTFDFDKKELEKIEFNPDDLIEESYQQQADDLIDTVTEKSKWSEEDEYMMDSIISDIEGLKETTLFPVNKEAYDDEIDWLKSIKERLKGK